MKTVFVLVDNGGHEPNIVGVYRTESEALNAWREYYLDLSPNHTLDDDEYEHYLIQATPLASK